MTKNDQQMPSAKLVQCLFIIKGCGGYLRTILKFQWKKKTQQKYNG